VEEGGVEGVGVKGVVEGEVLGVDDKEVELDGVVEDQGEM
jgi:hypothetical protein